jgi:periodic tryptophan protein 1
MVTATTWVPRGFAAPFPTRYNFDEEEFERIANLAKLQLDDAQEDLEEAEARESEAQEQPEKVSKKEKKAKTAEKDDDASEYAPCPIPLSKPERGTHG